MSMTLDLICKDGTVTFISAEDAVRVMDKSILHNRSTGYAVVNGKGMRPTNLARFLLNAQPGRVVDHINRVRLDNRRSNLREVTWAENAQNREQRRGNTPRATAEEAAALRSIRELAGVSIADMSERLGVCPGYLCRIENGQRLGPAGLLEAYRAAAMAFVMEQARALLDVIPTDFEGRAGLEWVIERGAEMLAEVAS